MKRWDFTSMMNEGAKLFASIHKRKRMAHANHDVHLLARHRDEWLSQGVQSLIDGTYTPRFLKRYYFKDERVDQLYLSDRILQNVLLKQLKPTFAEIMNPNCYHLQGPSGVKGATQRIKEAIASEQPKYILRTDIKSYYKSIRHSLLIQDVKDHYSDPKVQLMLENIIRNPIETPRGYKNPDHGIALRGPLSQFFSALYLKPLDDAFDTMEVTTLRYQDDILILCQTKRQLERSKQRLMGVLRERRLQLSRKKTYIGAIDKGFHFLGIHYRETQTPDGTHVTRDSLDSALQEPPEHSLNLGGDNSAPAGHSDSLSSTIVPHARTLRKAREQAKQMVIDGVSLRRIKSYLRRWCAWWVRTSQSWYTQELWTWFLKACWDSSVARFATELFQETTWPARVKWPAGLNDRATA